MFAYFENDFEVRAKPFVNLETNSFDFKLMDYLNMSHRRIIMDCPVNHIIPELLKILRERRPGAQVHEYPHQVLIHDSSPVPPVDVVRRDDTIEVVRLPGRTNNLWGVFLTCCRCSQLNHSVDCVKVKVAS
jgi:hypothetical protein